MTAWLACLIAALVVGGLSPLHAFASPASEQLGSSSGGEDLGADPLRFIGVGGHYRAGHWTAIDLTPFDIPVTSTVSIETVDGDGATVQFEQPPGTPVRRFGYCRPGQEAAPLVISVSDEEGSSEVFRGRFPGIGRPADGSSMIPLGMPWAIAFGDPLGIDTLGANELLGRGASTAVTSIQEASQLPDQVVGLSGVDLLVITESASPILEKLETSQRAALRRWVISGGRVMVTLGDSAKTLLGSAPWLAELLPEAVRSAEVIRLSPSGFETFTNSQTRLQEFQGLRLPKIGRMQRVGQQLVAGRTTRRVSLPLAARYVAGMGRITVVSANLESELFRAWPQRLNLVEKLTSDVLNAERAEVGSSVRLSGYGDLSGQVRRYLDDFSLKRQVSFSVVALIIAGLIALVGPLDFLFLRRRSPWLGWFTFPAVAIVLSVGLVLASSPLASETQGESSDQIADGLIRANSLEVADLDSTTGTGRLFRWTYLYNHEAVKVDVTVEPTGRLAGLVDAFETKLVSALGEPGPAMGGIQIEGGSTGYRIPLELSALNGSDGSRAAGWSSQLSGIELAPSQQQIDLPAGQLRYQANDRARHTATRLGALGRFHFQSAWRRSARRHAGLSKLGLPAADPFSGG